MVLDFAVNDGHISPPGRDRQGYAFSGGARRGFEQLLRKSLKLRAQPAVALLHFFSWNATRDKVEVGEGVDGVRGLSGMAALPRCGEVAGGSGACACLTSCRQRLPAIVPIRLPRGCIAASQPCRVWRLRSLIAAASITAALTAAATAAATATAAAARCRWRARMFL